MKHAYAAIPSALMLGFIGYFHWNSAHAGPFHLRTAGLGWATRSTETATTPPTSIEAIGNDEYARRNGAEEANSDLSAGQFIVLEYGLYLPWDNERREIARTQYGLECRVVAGCIVSESQVRFVAAYNEVMQAAIIARFGPDVFDQLNQAGKALREKRLAKDPPAHEGRSGESKR